MKSRTSFFNGVIFRKNLTRFAPVWLMYTLCLLLGMFLLMDSSNLEYWFAANLGATCAAMAVVNCGYALLVAQALFGDLWNTRMCNALHAMPLRRECWFATHVASGFFFSLVPTAVMTLVSEYFIITASSMVDGWQIPLYFLLSTNLQYLFFFGLAVLAVFCSGNRIGMAVIYGIINFGAYLAYFLVDTLITPLYFGVITPQDIFLLFCPVAQLCNEPLIISERHKIFDMVAAGEEYSYYGTFRLGENWTYLIIVAALGVVILLLALQLYRRRRLECAGDFLSTRKLAPVFLVAFSITVGAVFQFVQAAFAGVTTQVPLFLYVGLVVGWFAGWMLLERQTRVFGKLKNWLGLAALAAAVAAVLYGAGLDPFGVEDYVPQADRIAKVEMVNGYRGVLETENPEEIADVLAIHRGILEEKLDYAEGDAEWRRAYEAAQALPQVQTGKVSNVTMAEKIGYRKYFSLRITYQLVDGRKITRQYYTWADSQMAAIAKPYFSRLDAVFYHYEDIQDADDLLAMVRAPEYFYVDNHHLPTEFLTAEMVEALFRAVIADAEAGTLAQDASFHEGHVVEEETRLQKSYRIDVSFVEQDLYFDVFADSEHCLDWLEESGILEYIAERNQIG